MSSLSSRVFGRRQVAALVVAVLALTGFAVMRSRQAQAHETQVQMKMTCLVAGAITVDYTVSHDPLTATAGSVLTVKTKTVVGLNPAAPEVAITGLKITIPNPPGVEPGGPIVVTGGNLTKTGEHAEGTNTILEMQANAGVTSRTLQNPDISIPVMLPAALAGQNVVFQAPSRFDLGIQLLGQNLTETCTADAANPPLLTIMVNAPATTTTTTMATTTTTRPTTTTTMATTTTTRATTTTTMATTTTTRATTTTSMATTTTTRATTTTTRPTTTTSMGTTTTRPTTTTSMGTTTTRPTTTSSMRTTTTHGGGNGESPLLKLLRKIICFLFRIGC